MVIEKRDTKVQNMKVSMCIVACMSLMAFAPISLFAEPASGNALEFGDVTMSALYPVRLDVKILENKTKVLGNTVVGPGENGDLAPKYTVVESTFLVRARAFGGDIYLPTYREDIVFSAQVTEPSIGTNTLVPMQPSIEIQKKLPQIKNKYLLKEYEEVDMRIKISFKVLPSAMPSRLVFAPRIDTILWYPALYENGQHDPGQNPETGERLLNIPLVNATYIPQQVTRVDASATPVILLKGSSAYSALKENIKTKSFANVIGILRSIFSK